MKKPLTRPLIKIFANGFYRENTGLLLTLFILVFINFFYTNVLNQTHLTREELIQNALKLVINSVSEPLGVILLLGIFSIYSLKCWQYVAKRLDGIDVQFLFYSTNAASWKMQMRAWLTVQFVVSLPIVVIGIYAVTVGIAFGYWLVPALIVFYLIGIITYSAYRYTAIVNNTVIKSFITTDINYLKSWPKPLFSLFFYELAARKRLAYSITKLASMASILLLLRIFKESHDDVRFFGVVALCVALSHVVLLYQANEFELFYMRFARNFPYGQGQLHGQKWILWGIIILPELLWFLLVGGLTDGLIGALLAMSLILLFHAILKVIGQHIYYYLRLTFGLFIIFLLINLFSLTLLLAIINFIAAWALLYIYRHRLVMEEG